MTRESFEFLKKIARYFRENPLATEHLGVSKETHFCLLSLHFSPPEEIIDPTAPDALTKIEEKINLFEERLNQNQPLPETILTPELEKATQRWQEETNKDRPLPQLEQFGRGFDGKLKNLSLKNFKKFKPEWASKISQFSGKGKALAKTAAFLGKAASVIGTPLLVFSFLASKPVRKALKVIGGFFVSLYAFLAALGLGALVGAAIGTIAGGIAGAILGFKLGLLVCAPLLAIPIIGPVLYVAGVALFTVGGAVVGAVVGTGLGFAIGFALDHWVWQPIQGAWTGTGNLLGGAGNLLGGAWSGFWTGVGNFFSGVVTGAGNLLSGVATAAGNLLSAAGGFLTNLGAQLATLSLPTFHLVTLPIVGSVGFIFIGSYMTNTAIQRSLIPEPPAEGIEGAPPSPYISLAKTGAFSGLGNPINYTLTLTAKDKNLTNLQITDNTTFSCAGSPPSVGPKAFSLASLAPGASSTLNYQTPTTAQFNNCSVTNIVTVRFDVPDDGKTGETASTSFTVTIGSPPASGCPVNNGVIFCGSYWTYDIYGCAHCDGGYIILCNSSSERAQAIDVKGPGGVADLDVYLPTLLGKSVNWAFLGEEVEVAGPDKDEFGNPIRWGWRKEFKTTVDGVNYGLRILHLNFDDPSLAPGEYPSGTKVGSIYNGRPLKGWVPHIHITASQGGIYLPADTTFHFCGG